MDKGYYERPKEERMQRNCLKCARAFKARGRFNRVCDSCKGKIDYNDTHSIPAVDLLPAHRKGVPN